MNLVALHDTEFSVKPPIINLTLNLAIPSICQFNSKFNNTMDIISAPREVMCILDPSMTEMCMFMPNADMTDGISCPNMIFKT